MSSANEPKSKKNSYSLKRKLEVVEYAIKHSNHKAADFFSVDRKRVIEWRRQEDQIKNQIAASGAKQMRLSGGGRQPLSDELETELYGWIMLLREKRQRVSRRLIQREATKIAGRLVDEEKMEDGAFLASRGWLENFLKRKNLTLRRTTTVCQKPPAEYCPKLVDFVMHIRTQRKIKQYPYGQTYACDETAVVLDPVGRYCISPKGAREVCVQSTGHEKLHITVMLCARDDGSKCLPFVLLPRKRPMPEIIRKFSGKLVLSWAGKVWMDDPLTAEFLKKVIGQFAFSKRQLVWDSFRCHISKQTKEELKKLGIDIAVIPGGCTKFVQAPDVCWNKPFKDLFNKLYEDWMLSGEKSYTSGGNMRAPDMETYLGWVYEAWKQFENKFIKDSFKTVRVSNAIDGSEDDLIHCFKEDGPCPEGRALLKERMEEFNKGGEAQVIHVEEEVDRDEDENNGYASDASAELYPI